MQNDVKRPADKMALQITKPARKAQFVDEDSYGRALVFTGNQGQRYFQMFGSSTVESPC